MASVKDRTVQWVDPVTGRRMTRTLDTPEMARWFRTDREKEAALLRGRFIDGGDLEHGKLRQTPLVDVLDDYIGRLRKLGRSVGHRTDTRRALDAVIASCRARIVSDLDARRIERYLADLVARGRSARTHNYHAKAIKAFGRWLVDYEYLDRNPAGMVRTMDESKDSRRPSRALTVLEAEALLASAGDHRLLCLLRLRTGLRVLEAGRLLWGDVDLRERVVVLRPEITKNGKADRLPLADDLLDALAADQADRLRRGGPAGPSDPIFASSPDWRGWQRIIDRAGIEKKTPDGQADAKAIRKTFGSHLTRSGVELTLVSLLMRHTPSGGMALTVGVYGDQEALLVKKRQAIRRMLEWIELERVKGAAPVQRGRSAAS